MEQEIFNLATKFEKQRPTRAEMASAIEALYLKISLPNGEASSVSENEHTQEEFFCYNKSKGFNHSLCSKGQCSTCERMEKKL